jgi:hypothetical protein
LLAFWILLAVVLPGCAWFTPARQRSPDAVLWHDPPLYLTWLLRPTPGGCTVRLAIDEVDTADSPEDAEDIWLPVLAALQRLLNPG